MIIMNDTFLTEEAVNEERIMTLSPKKQENHNTNNNNNNTNNTNNNNNANDVSELEQTNNCYNDSGNSNSNSNNNVESKNLTRLQLTFSVDRLLNNSNSILSNYDMNECNRNSNGNCNHDNIKHYNINDSIYQYCACAECIQSSSQQLLYSQMLQSNGKFIHYSMSPLGMPNKPLMVENARKHLSLPRQSLQMDIKNIVRPTPLRAVGNNNGNANGLCNSIQTSSLYRLHYQTIQQNPMIGLTKPQNYLCSSLTSSRVPTNSTYTPYTIAAISSIATTTSITTATTITTTAATTSLNHLQMKNHFNQLDMPLIGSINARVHTIRSQDPSVSSCLIHGSNIKVNQELNSGSTNSLNNAFMSGCCGDVVVSGGSGSSIGNLKTLNNGKRKRSWSRAVFSNLQRKGLEIQFQQQKYITKPDRRKLAARLNLTDAQVKVWFQNRRMKWRHTRENVKSGHEKHPNQTIEMQLLNNTSVKTITNNNNSNNNNKRSNNTQNNIIHQPLMHYSSDDTSDSDDVEDSDNDIIDNHNEYNNENDEDEIDVVQ